MDAEEEPAPSDQVEEHLAGCESCRRWQDAAAGLTRTLRVRPAEHTPDLTDQILAAVSVPAGQPRRATLRWALGGVAFIQLVLGLAQLLGVDHTGHLAAGDGSQHLFNESTAWNLGLAVGFLVAAVRPSLARGVAARARCLRRRARRGLGGRLRRRTGRCHQGRQPRHDRRRSVPAVPGRPATPSPRAARR